MHCNYNVAINDADISRIVNTMLQINDTDILYIVIITNVDILNIMRMNFKKSQNTIMETLNLYHSRTTSTLFLSIFIQPQKAKTFLNRCLKFKKFKIK